MKVSSYIAKQMDIEHIPVWIKKVIFNLCIFIGAYFAPIYAKGITIFIFLLIDMGTGIWAAKHEGEAIRSNKARRSISKFITYITALCVALMFTKEFGVDIITIVAFGIASIEVKSIFENLYRITDINFIKWIHKAVKSKHDTTIIEGKEQKDEINEQSS